LVGGVGWWRVMLRGRGVDVLAGLTFRGVRPVCAGGVLGGGAVGGRVRRRRFVTSAVLRRGTMVGAVVRSERT